jgi:hypothetical protein
MNKVYTLFKRYAGLRKKSGKLEVLHLCVTSTGEGWIMEEYADVIIQWGTVQEGVDILQFEIQMLQA